MSGTVVVQTAVNQVTVNQSPANVVEIQASGTQGVQGDSWQEEFETVSKNLKSYSASFSYAGDQLTSITYAAPGGDIVKTFGYNGLGELVTITLSGNTPLGIDLVKTLSYTAGVLTGVSYA